MGVIWPPRQSFPLRESVDLAVIGPTGKRRRRVHAPLSFTVQGTAIAKRLRSLSASAPLERRKVVSLCAEACLKIPVGKKAGLRPENHFYRSIQQSFRVFTRLFQILLR